MREAWLRAGPSTGLRAGLGLLAAAESIVGVWALAAPRSFYDDFPGGGRQWVSALPPYNEHLLRDVGGLNLAMALLFLWATIVLERRLVVGALVAYLVYAVPHLAFHLANLEDLSNGDQVGQTFSLALAVVLPLVLLPLTLRLAREAGGQTTGTPAGS